MLKRAYTSVSLCHCPLCEDVYEYFYPQLTFSSSRSISLENDDWLTRRQKTFHGSPEFVRRKHDRKKFGRSARVGHPRRQIVKNGLCIKGIGFDMPFIAWEDQMRQSFLQNRGTSPPKALPTSQSMRPTVCPIPCHVNLNDIELYKQGLSYLLDRRKEKNNHKEVSVEGLYLHCGPLPWETAQLTDSFDTLRDIGTISVFR